ARERLGQPYRCPQLTQRLVERRIVKRLDQQERREGLLARPHRFLTGCDRGSSLVDLKEPARDDSVQRRERTERCARCPDVRSLTDDRNDHGALTPAGFGNETPSATNEVLKDRHDAA